MSLTSPDRLIWLWVVIPIIGFYILRTRLRRRRVATLLFWDQLFDEKRQRSLWQNLRHWLSLLMQLLIVSVIVMALVDPVFNLRPDTSQELVLIIDNSASMQATRSENGPTRLDEALREASTFVSGLRQGDEAALLTAGSSVQVVVGMTDFGPAIQDSLETIEPTDGPTQITDAILAARRLANDPVRRRIVVFSDRSFDVDDPIEDATDVRWVQVGESVDNVAITQFQARRSTVDPLGYALLIELQNLSDSSAEGRLTLKLGESLVDVIPWLLEPNESWQTTVDGTSRKGGILTASIDSEDGLAADNVARAIVPDRPTIPVHLTTSAESDAYYLTTVLDSIPLLNLVDDDSVDSNQSGHLHVFNQTVPSEIPDGPVLLVAPKEDGPPITVDGTTAPAWKLGGEIKAPLIAKQDEESPLLTHVQLLNVLLDQGRDIQVHEELGEVTTLLESAEGAALLVAVDRPQGRILILSTNLDSSDLPLRIAFPVMMTNAVNWFMRRTNEINPALSTGQVASVPWDAPDTGEDSQLALLIDPNGNRRRVTVDRQRARIGPVNSVGVFALDAPSAFEQPEPNRATPKTPEELMTEIPRTKGELVAVNLCNAAESDLRQTEYEDHSAEDLPPAGAPGWLYLIFGAVGVVLTEWTFFNRRVIS